MATRDDLENRPHTVYRYYDADGHPLYIGCTVNLKQRERSHAEKLWWPMVVRREVETLPNRNQALSLEQVYIERESPLYNIKHNHHAERSSELMLQFREAIARDPSRYHELYAELETQIDLSPPSWLKMHKQREQWKRAQRRLRESQFRARRIAEIKARRAS